MTPRVERIAGIVAMVVGVLTVAALISGVAHCQTFELAKLDTRESVSGVYWPQQSAPNSSEGAPTPLTREVAPRGEPLPGPSPRLFLTASKLQPEAHRGIVGDLIGGLAIFEGDGCVPRSAISAVRISAGEIRTAIRQANVPVISKASAYAAAVKTRSRKAKVALAVVPFIPLSGQAIVALRATDQIRLGSGWVAGLGLAATVLPSILNAFKPEAESVTAPLDGLWLDDLHEVTLDPGGCLPLFRFMSKFPVRFENFTIAVQ